jgi:hypothetical protein
MLHSYFTRNFVLACGTRLPEKKQTTKCHIQLLFDLMDDFFLEIIIFLFCEKSKHHCKGDLFFSFDFSKILGIVKQ